MKSYRKNYTGLRFRTLPVELEPDAVTMKTARRWLGISPQLQRSWKLREDFTKATVLFKRDGKLYAHRERLYLWLVYIGAIRLRPGKIASNPPVGKSEYRKQRRDDARKGLGL